MKLNPPNCSFGVASDKILGFILNSKGIEASLEEIKALSDVEAPKSRRKMQSLHIKVIALSQFISKVTDKCVLFFDALKKAKGKFVWMDECQKAFDALLDHMERTPFL